MMAFEPSLKTRQCLVWETKRPNRGRPLKSPVFTLMNSQWFLKITYESARYTICIINSRGLNTFPSFCVTSYLENWRTINRPILTNKRFISPTKNTVWWGRIFDISQHIARFEDYDDFTIVCVFHTLAESVSPVKKKTEHRSIQTAFWESPLNLENLSQDFAALLGRNLMPDVQLKCGDRTIPVHKAVLVARSDVFSAMFQHEMAEANSGIIDIKDVEPTVLEAFLKYLYSGKVPDNLEEDMVPKLYATGDKYAVYSLTKVCSDFMARNVNEGNFLEFLILSEAHNDKELKETVAGFITKRETLLTSDVWIEFSKEHPKLAVEIYQKHVGKALSK